MTETTPFKTLQRVLNAGTGRPADTPLHPADELSALGFDSSLALVQLIVQLEEAFEIDLPVESLDIATFESVQTLWSVLAELIRD